MGIFMILGLIIIGVKIFYNVEEIKLMNSNVCALCEKWTGGKCLAMIGSIQINKPVNIPEINASWGLQ
jgi:hypothetical protein